MSNSLNAVAAAIQVLVTALVVVEHDREKHIPGVTSGPNAETFYLPADVADSLVKAGAVKLVEVIDADAMLAGNGHLTIDTAATGGDVSTGLVTTFADVADMVDADRLRAQLAEAQAQNQSLLDELAYKQTQLDTAHTQLETAQAKLGIVHARLAEATGTTDPAATGTTDAAATGNADPAATGTADPAATGTADLAATGTADLAATGTADQAAIGTTGTADAAATGTADPAATGTTDAAASGNADPAATGTKPAAKTSSRKAS